MSSLKLGWWRFLGGSANFRPTRHVFFLLDNVLMARLGRAGRLCHDWLFLTQVDTQDRNEPLSFIPDQRKEYYAKSSLNFLCYSALIVQFWLFGFSDDVLIEKFCYEQSLGRVTCAGFISKGKKSLLLGSGSFHQLTVVTKSLKYFEKPSNPCFAPSCSWWWFLTKICIRELVTGCHRAKL